MATNEVTDTLPAPPDRVYDVLTDFDAYARWHCLIRACEVLQRDAGTPVLVRMVVDAKVRGIDTTVRVRLDRPRLVSWELASGDMRRYSVRYDLTPGPDGTTSVASAFDAEPTFYVPGPIKKALGAHSIGKTLHALRGYLAAGG